MGIISGWTQLWMEICAREKEKSRGFFGSLPPQREPRTGNSGPWTLAQRAGRRRKALQGLERGQVIQTSINKRTNTANAALQKAAEDAARKARFNAVDGVNNQTGTITYYFKLK